MPESIHVDTEEGLIISDSCSKSIPLVPQKPAVKKSVTIGQAIGIGAGAAVVGGVIVYALFMYTIDQMFEGLSFHLDIM
jgi:hypothetical protein